MSLLGDYRCCHAWYMVLHGQLQHGSTWRGPDEDVKATLKLYLNLISDPLALATGPKTPGMEVRHRPHSDTRTDEPWVGDSEHNHPDAQQIYTCIAVKTQVLCWNVTLAVAVCISYNSHACI
jgi:hypothetical protein